MNDFEKIKDFDSEIHEVFVEYAPLIFDINKTIAIPKTANAFLLFIAKTNFIKEGIFELFESQNLYSINILYRCLIEHFLRFQYIFMRSYTDKNDSIGDDYMKFCSLSENIDTGKAWKDIAKIIDKDPGIDPYDMLKELNADFKSYSKEEIVEKSSQFRYKNIIKFINNKINKEKVFSKNAFILSIIPEYSDLSSFVHGGPSSDKTMMDNISEDHREKELLKKIDLSFFMAASVKMFSFLIYYQYDKRFGKAYLKIDSIIKENNR